MNNFMPRIPDMPLSDKTLALYKGRNSEMKRTIRYEFYLFGPLDTIPPRTSDGHKFAMKIPYPQVFHAQEPELLGYVGYIKYLFFGTKTIMTYDYRPKGAERKKNNAYGVRSLGYFNEFLACADLALNHPKLAYIITTDTPEPERRRQLEKVGLPIGIATPLERWVEGLVAGIEFRL